jgi:NUDIX domain.
MARVAARRAVAAIEPFDERERVDQVDTLAWIDSGAPIWRTAAPATPPEHLVVYCVLVDLDARSLLLVDHRNAGLWLPTGGHVDPEEHPADAARRELAEELSVRAPFASLDSLFVTRTLTVGLDGGHTDVSLWYAFGGTQDMPVTPDPGEFTDHRWWPFADATSGARVDPELPRFVAKLTTLIAPATANP